MANPDRDPGLKVVGYCAEGKNIARDIVGRVRSATCPEQAWERIKERFPSGEELQGEIGAIIIRVIAHRFRGPK